MFIGHPPTVREAPPLPNIQLYRLMKNEDMFVCFCLIFFLFFFLVSLLHQQNKSILVI
jgi:hypothetical protein